MDTLTQLAIKYGTDKWGKHNYTPVYYDLFANKRNMVHKLLEIGPAEGAGLLMFREFFPNAEIFGLEIDHQRVEALKNHERITVYEGDQSNLHHIWNLLNLTEGLDIVIDDGSHNPLDQIFTFQAIVPHLKKGATYIIEDVADDDVINILSHKYYVEVKRVGDRYDDRLIICQK